MEELDDGGALSHRGRDPLDGRLVCVDAVRPIEC